MPDGPVRKSDESPADAGVQSDDAAGTPADPSDDGKF
jgi:hypothetical protein